MKQLLLLMSLLIFSCTKEEVEKEKLAYAPGEVLVGLKNGTRTADLFDFINSYGHRTERIGSWTFTSSLPPDSLSYVLNTLNSKSYTKQEGRQSSGFLHYQTQVITVTVRLYGMENKAYQKDWLQVMEQLALTEYLHPELSGGTLHLHVPPGQEQHWISVFKNYPLVEWAELNHYGDYVLFGRE